MGAGPLAGPVVAAACILDHNSIGKYRTKNKWYFRVRDSKTTTEEEREMLREEILKHTIAYGIGEVWQEEIDVLNIHHASLRAMRLAVEDLIGKTGTENAKAILFVDGRFPIPGIKATSWTLEQKSVVGGDALILSISAASIIAKTHRDAIMRKLSEEFPEYGFARHKGYGTKEHNNAIRKFGITKIHRKSFIKV